VTTFLLLLLSCNSSQTENKEQPVLIDSLEIENTSDTLGKSYFDFDEVDHFHSDTGHVFFREDSLLTSKELLFKKIFEGDFPDAISDTSFVSELTDLGFIKEDVDTSKNKGINFLFREKDFAPYEVAACIPEYRDILIFRKSKKIIGIAKVCFTCSALFATGTDAITSNFGSYDGFGKLGNLLYDANEN